MRTSRLLIEALILSMEPPSLTLSRRSRERPDLFARVGKGKGKLSANAAAIEAGIRKKLSAFEQILKLLPKPTTQERINLKDGW